MPVQPPDGNELYFVDLDGKLMAVDVKLDTTIDSGSPRMLFDTGLDIDPVYSQYLVHPDGQRFLLAKPVAEQTSRPITVVLNWQAQLKK